MDDPAGPRQSTGSATGIRQGSPSAKAPAGADQRAACYRAALSGKRALVVLDDAASNHQVVPLLPPQGCAAIVTSRAPLGGLLEKGAKPLRLGQLSRAEALALLASRLGRVRVVLQPWGAARLIDACDGLPQALVIVAALLASPAEQRTRRGGPHATCTTSRSGRAPGSAALLRSSRCPTSSSRISSARPSSSWGC